VPLQPPAPRRARPAAAAARPARRGRLAGVVDGLTGTDATGSEKKSQCVRQLLRRRLELELGEKDGSGEGKSKSLFSRAATSGAPGRKS
jgi:hypothetical protein